MISPSAAQREELELFSRRLHDDLERYRRDIARLARSPRSGALTDPFEIELFAELERIAAEAGVRVVFLLDPGPIEKPNLVWAAENGVVSTLLRFDDPAALPRALRPRAALRPPPREQGGRRDLHPRDRAAHLLGSPKRGGSVIFTEPRFLLFFVASSPSTGGSSRARAEDAAARREPPLLRRVGLALPLAHPGLDADRLLRVARHRPRRRAPERRAGASPGCGSRWSATSACSASSSTSTSSSSRRSSFAAPARRSSSTRPTLEIVLPVGISFYTFQTLSYTIDVYRGELEPRAQPARLRALRRLLPAARRRPDRARERLPAAARGTRDARSRRRGPRAPDALPDRLRQEGVHRRQRRARRSTRSSPTPARSPRRAAWTRHGALLRPDLLRLLGLLRHGDRDRRAARLPAGAELRLPLSRARTSREFWRRWHITSRPGCATTCTSRSAATGSGARPPSAT